MDPAYILANDQSCWGDKDLTSLPKLFCTDSPSIFFATVFAMRLVIFAECLIDCEEGQLGEMGL